MAMARPLRREARDTSRRRKTRGASQRGEARTGPESPERYQQLAAAVDEHCPVLDLFRNPVPVDRTITVH